MLDKLLKSLLCIVCILIFGTGAFAQSLNSVEINSDFGNGKIILDTDMKSAVKKTKISQNEIKLELKNTIVSDNIKTVYDNTSAYNGISIMQNGKNSYINISGENIAEYELLYANDNSIIPVSSGLKDFGVLFVIFSFVSFILSKKLKNFADNRKENLRKMVMEQSERQQKIVAEQKRIRELKTLRAKVKNANNRTIHENSVPKFASNTKMSVPITLQYNNSKVSAFSELKKAVNL